MLLTEFTLAVQVLLLASAMPAVARDLGGTHLYGTVLGASAIGLLFASPLAGRAADRLDPVAVLAISTLLTGLGMIVSALAPAMLLVALGRLLVGGGSATQYVVSLTGLTRELPAPVRTRVFAVMSFGWILPGLVGPPVGGALATSIGWRWVMIAPVPLVLLSQLFLLPTLRSIARPEGEAGPMIPVAWSVILALGMAAILVGLALSGWHGVVLLLVGLGLSFVGLRHVLPPGTLSARAGLPAILAVQFLANTAYFAGDGFVPLALARVLGYGLALAGAALTFSSLGWSAGSWWQSRVPTLTRPGRYAAIGGGLIAAGSLGVAGGIIGAPGILPYLGWGFAGVGMGMATQTSWLAGTELASTGNEGSVVSSLLMTETVGLSLGAGAAGGIIALSGVAGVSLRDGLLGAFLFVAFVAVLAALVGSRLRPWSG